MKLAYLILHCIKRKLNHDQTRIILGHQEWFHNMKSLKTNHWKIWGFGDLHWAFSFFLPNSNLVALPEPMATVSSKQLIII